MKNLFISYKKLSYEQRVILITSLGLCFSTLLTCGKFIVGLFFNYNLCIIAIYTLALHFSSSSFKARMCQGSEI